MVDNPELWKKRADELLQKGRQMTGSEAVQGATSILTALYGPDSPQLRQFRDGCDAIVKSTPGNPINLQRHLNVHALGVIRNAKAELEGGLIVRLRIAIAGEILTEIMRVGKDILVDRTEEAKNVGAVLVSAAFEGMIRRMGEDFGGVTGRPKLEEVISGLKSAEVLKGGQVGTALSYLQFRNDSLHADWAKVDRSQVESCLAFVESLLTKHFS
jgi:hypothetical protein